MRPPARVILAQRGLLILFISSVSSIALRHKAPPKTIMNQPTVRSKTDPKKFHIKTFGCQMNVADTERMASLLGDQGLSSTENAAEAGVIILNGCSVREKAVHKAVSALGRLQDLKSRDDNGQATGPIIGIGGCVGQLDKGALFKSAPYLDFVFGTDAIDQLPEIVHRVKHGERHVVYTEFDKSMDYSTETRVSSAKATAYVNIMKGCDKYCTYCIVPFTRGREKSRKIDEVVSDIARLVATGVREVTLLGQNVNSFGKGNPNEKGREPTELHNVIGKVGPRAGEENFPQLLRAIDQDPRCAALKRIRFTSSHPLDFSDELIECYAPGTVKRLAMNLHLPVQCGSNRILQKMGRHHQIENYISQMDRLRAICPEVGISTDLIVGFPTETEEDFQETLKLLDRIQYDNIYAFAYSPRPGTRAEKMPDDVSTEVKNDRLNRLLNHQMVISNKTYRDRIGKTMEVLVEGEAKKRKIAENITERVWTGHTSCNRIVNFATSAPRNLLGQFVDVKIVCATATSLEGELL